MGEKIFQDVSTWECPNQVVMMSFCLTQWILHPVINRNNINRRKSEWCHCERHSLGVTGSRLCRQQTNLNLCYVCLLNKRVALLPAQCYESTAFCLVGFYKNCCKLPLLQMLKLFVFTFLKWHDVTFLKAEHFSSAKGIWQNQAKFLNCLASLALHFFIKWKLQIFLSNFKTCFYCQLIRLQ